LKGKSKKPGFGGLWAWGRSQYSAAPEGQKKANRGLRGKKKGREIITSLVWAKLRKRANRGKSERKNVCETNPPIFRIPRNIRKKEEKRKKLTKNE